MPVDGFRLMNFLMNFYSVLKCLKFLKFYWRIFFLIKMNFTHTLIIIYHLSNTNAFLMFPNSQDNWFVDMNPYQSFYNWNSMLIELRQKFKFIIDTDLKRYSINFFRKSFVIIINNIFHINVIVSDTE